MATRFPTNFSDTFTRANGVLGAPWFGQGLSINTNQVTGSGTAFASLLGLGYAVGTSRDVAIQVTLSSVGGDTTDQFSLFLRMNSSGTTGYKARWLHDGTISILLAETSAVLATTTLRAPATGDILGFQAYGDTLTVFVNTSPVLSVLDSKHREGETMGFGNTFATSKVDSFSVIARQILDGLDTTSNTNASINTVNNELICDRSGFRVSVDEGLVREWTGAMVRKDLWEPRHPQDFVRGVPEHPKGSTRPQQPDSFITTPITPADLG